MLFNTLFSWTILIFLAIIFFSGASNKEELLEAVIFFYLSATLIGTVMMIPSLAAVARRLHDTGRSAWLYLISLVPLLGIIVLLVCLCEDSQKGENKWGPNPKEPNLQQ